MKSKGLQSKGRKFSVLVSVLLACVMMFSMLSACTGKKEEENEPTPTEKSASTTPAPIEEEEPKGGLPIVDQPLTLNVLMYKPYGARAHYVDDLNDHPVFMELEKRTNIHLNFLIPTKDVEFNLMFAETGSKAPDLVMNSWKYFAGGPAKALKDGAIIDVKELVEKFAPNLQRVFSEFPEAETKDYVSRNMGGRIEPDGPWSDRQERLAR